MIVWNEIAPEKLLAYLPFQARFVWENCVLARVELLMKEPGLVIEGTVAEKGLTRNWLMGYFQGETYELPLKKAPTFFQQQVHKAMREIPFGTTLSYSDLAKFVGNERAVRAIGSACGKNHLPLVNPCHRVISKNGSIGGFSLDIRIKACLLQLEKETRLSRHF